jgi:hypothetical protein
MMKESAGARSGTQIVSSQVGENMGGEYLFPNTSKNTVMEVICRLLACKAVYHGSTHQVKVTELYRKKMEV